MLNWWNHTANLALRSFCEGNPFVRAAVWHCEAQLTAHRVPPPGRPVVSSRIDCVSLRSYWGTDHTALRHLHPFINTLLMHARGSIWQRSNRRRGPCWRTAAVCGTHTPDVVKICDLVRQHDSCCGASSRSRRSGSLALIGVFGEFNAECIWI